MFGIHDLPLFIISCILLNLTPGQDTLYIIGRSVAQGRTAGIVSVIGIMTGVLVHTLLAALGLSVILATSAMAFAIVKYAGALYLIWIGVRFLVQPDGSGEVAHTADQTRKRWKIFSQGVLTNVLNPKVALFFLSFLPQFVSAQTQMVVVPFIVLGLLFFTTGSIWGLVLVYGASWLSTRFRRRSSLGRVFKRLPGLLFVGLGIRLAFSQAR
ncbi:lysine transporter LysE [Desulfosarcina ovata subsp. sediminis]|uniref:Lysine transporter LysE n=1 Tax=Desulfosarcina ovata subsp. sediminis TaxID=885957 RepID=A0A5K7ZXY4_9BACT|nr:LysE family translocator [Desulfosarcina ovata]BBO85119.1 lysine transporter LysE [Desulfosarcina ovata subsp. sediminis]